MQKATAEECPVTGMVERVAKAIHNSEYNGDGEFHWREKTADIYRRAACSAIAAMREPTPEMTRKWNVNEDEHTGFQEACPMCGGHLEGWRIMIDAALKGCGEASLSLESWAPQR